VRKDRRFNLGMRGRTAIMDIERLLGRLEEFREWEKQEHSRLEKQFCVIEGKIDSLNSFRWKIIGICSAISVVLTLITGVAVRLL